MAKSKGFASRPNALFGREIPEIVTLFTTGHNSDIAPFSRSEAGRQGRRLRPQPHGVHGPGGRHLPVLRGLQPRVALRPDRGRALGEAGKVSQGRQRRQGQVQLVLGEGTQGIREMRLLFLVRQFSQFALFRVNMVRGEISFVIVSLPSVLKPSVEYRNIGTFWSLAYSRLYQRT